MLSLALAATSFLLAPLGPASPATRASRFAPCRSTPCAMKLDMKDLEVAQEYESVMALRPDEVTSELELSGIPPPPTMNDFDLRSMLVEMRLRKSGKVGQKKEMKKPPASATAFEKALYEKPRFRELYEDFQKSRQQNEYNLCIEYLNDPVKAEQLYGGNDRYVTTVAKIKAALSAKKEVTSGKITFSGFPANMGEAGLRMTLEAFGDLKSLSTKESDDGMTVSGRAEFKGGAEAAKAAIKKWDGVDMGLGNALELSAQ